MSFQDQPNHFFARFNFLPCVFPPYCCLCGSVRLFYHCQTYNLLLVLDIDCRKSGGMTALYR